MHHVVIVDDEPTLSHVLADKLMDSAVIHTAEDWTSAKEKIKEVRPKVIILDFVLPEVSGIEALKEIKNTHEAKGAHVIILTAMVDEEKKKECAELGADEFLIKSEVKIAQLEEIVKKYLDNGNKEK